VDGRSRESECRDDGRLARFLRGLGGAYACPEELEHAIGAEREDLGLATFRDALAELHAPSLALRAAAMDARWTR